MGSVRKFNFQRMWHCKAPGCKETFPFHLCLPCGRASAAAGDRWLTCLSLSLEWADVTKNAYSAVAKVTAMLQMERWKKKVEEKEKEEQVDAAEEEQEEHEGKEKGDAREHVAKVEPARSRM